MAVPNWLTYSNQNATRSQPLNPDLVRALSFLPELGITLDVYSGGQPAAGQGPRVGSTRHDHGNAADVRFLRDGRMLDWNNQSDLPLLQDIVSRARASGITGIGAGDDYMGAGRFHVGFGPEAVWGAGGSSANAPDWLRSAFYDANGPTENIARRVAAASGGGGISGLARTEPSVNPEQLLAGLSGLPLEAEPTRRTAQDYGLSVPENPRNAWEGLQSASGNIASALLNFYRPGA